MMFSMNTMWAEHRLHAFVAKLSYTVSSRGH